ncbi:MAG: hypothetical protein ACK4SA_07215 [Caldilinea sp.]
MNLGHGFALQFGVGLHIASGRPPLKRQFVAAWGKTEVFARNATPWDLARQRAWLHRSGWSICIAQTFRSGYGLRLERGHQLGYGDLRVHRRRWMAPYDSLRFTTTRFTAAYADQLTIRIRQRIEIVYHGRRDVRAQHRAHYAAIEPNQIRAQWRLSYGATTPARAAHRTPWGLLTSGRQTLRTPYGLNTQVVAKHTVDYAITETNPVSSALATSWSLLDDARLQAVMNTPELIWRERAVRILEASLSCDEGSPVWMARIELAETDDFAAIAIGDRIRLVLGLEAFELVVDGKTLSRSSSTEQRAEITALSPLALLDAPFASSLRYYAAEPVSARSAVTDLIGTVIWQLPEWIIPAGRLLLDGTTPLAAARSIVGAIGGMIESEPDGSVLCRRRHPVGIPDYPQAGVAHALFDSDVLSVQAQIAPLRGFNRVTVANEDGAGTAAGDQLEFVPDEGNAMLGTVRANLGNRRPVVLAHTGHPATVVASLGEVARRESETIEFIEGRARTRYPVTTIESAEWQHAVLGDVSHSGTRLDAATAGYSLLRITYTTTSLNWRGGLSADEEVQFVLLDP